MNSATHPAEKLQTLADSLNAKARAAKSDVRCSVLDRIEACPGHWTAGVAITGKGDHARAYAYVRAYVEKHIAPLARSYATVRVSTVHRGRGETHVALLHCLTGEGEGDSGE